MAKPATTSARKALVVLESIGLFKVRSFAEISADVRLPKSTLLRLIGDLVEQGFVRRTAHGGYTVALKMWRIGCNAVQFEQVHDQVMPIMRSLVDRIGETTHYAVYENGYSLYVEKVDGVHPIRSYTSVGGRSPAYATATGKTLLAWRDQSEIERIAKSAERWTKRTIIRPAAIIKEMAEVRRLGYAVNRGEWRESVWGVAAPVYDRHDKVIAAVGITGPADRMELKLPTYAKHVLAAASEISRHCGAMMEAS
ncbi:MAG: IclR family transcriptional regulator [Vulcanimicrobiaceae bacterium]